MPALVHEDDGLLYVDPLNVALVYELLELYELEVNDEVELYVPLAVYELALNDEPYVFHELYR